MLFGEVCQRKVKVRFAAWLGVRVNLLVPVTRTQALVATNAIKG
jgi:hypothetical protein